MSGPGVLILRVFAVGTIHPHPARVFPPSPAPSKRHARGYRDAYSYGTYGPAFEDGASAFPNPVDTPLDNFYSCGDCVFPGVGVPAVAVSGANVANSCVGPLPHLRLINRLQRDLKLTAQASAAGGGR